ncbi:MAG: type II toxin-antitoxin system prevent-host-death family antitoxin [Candidatus Rokubacteria bacterium]|nr:type II toxin-antitoxin system prevent-host-death family antitoxin [Candidatus Rokubacteria bacterium]
MKPQPTVGVRDLRARLSAYLRSVSNGASITIRDRRRRPVARLVPVLRSPESELLNRLADQGILRRGVGKPGQGPRVKSRGRRRLLSDVVIEDRR